MEFICPDISCQEKYGYCVEEDSSAVGFKIGDWYFDLNKLTGITEFANVRLEEIFRIPQIVEVNESNYLKVIERARNLILYR